MKQIFKFVLFLNPNFNSCSNLKAPIIENHNIISAEYDSDKEYMCNTPEDINLIKDNFSYSENFLEQTNCILKETDDIFEKDDFEMSFNDFFTFRKENMNQSIEFEAVPSSNSNLDLNKNTNVGIQNCLEEEIINERLNKDEFSVKNIKNYENFTSKKTLRQIMNSSPKKLYQSDFLLEGDKKLKNFNENAGINAILNDKNLKREDEIKGVLLPKRKGSLITITKIEKKLKSSDDDLQTLEAESISNEKNLLREQSILNDKNPIRED